MRPEPVASTRHTLILLAILGGVAALGAVNRAGAVASAPAPGSHAVLYLVMIAAEWLLFRYALLGLRRAGTPLKAIFGEPPRTLRSALLVIAVGALAWFAFGVLATGIKQALTALGLPVHADDARTIAAVRPHGALETGLWVALSISAGVCEEFVFRGYLMRQFAAWFGGRAQGLIASSIVFGLGHAWEGLAPMLVITGLGLAFGGLALAMKRLAPGIVGHALMDVVAGLTGR